ncbi:hypothetical protein ACGFNU_31010 [Spirillospora sp. NPDC048911]|uniref:hypothetical protein n=1 Tax=Spirillospora sp. NPDC048911 TaxID=3364527 RepID=UPI00372255B6
MAKVRAELQAKGTKSAKRKLKARARREARHATHINHRIAKTVVADAERTGRGIVSLARTVPAGTASVAGCAGLLARPITSPP